MERRDSSKHPTFLRCSNTCSFTLQIPTINEINRNNNNYDNYTLTLELRFEKLPLIGNLQSLLRFSIPDITNARKIHRTSVYLNGDGIVVGKPIERDGYVNNNDTNDNKELDIMKSNDDNSNVNNNDKNNDKHDEVDDNNTAIDDTVLPAASIDTTTIVLENKNNNEKDTNNTISTTTSTSSSTSTITPDNNDDINSNDCKDKEKKLDSDDNINTKVSEKVVSITNNNNKKKINPVRIRAGIWSIVSVVVNPMEGKLESYIDGKVSRLLCCCYYYYCLQIVF